MSLEHPYQRSSLRCSEGRGGMIFFKIFCKSTHNVVGILSCQKLAAKKKKKLPLLRHLFILLSRHKGPSRLSLDLLPHILYAISDLI